MMFQIRFIVVFLILSLFSSALMAQGFAAVISPPRVEIQAKPGQNIRQVLEIVNDSPSPSVFKIKSADWSLDSKDNWSVSFFDGPQGVLSSGTSLSANSCRPWLALEAHEVRLGPGAKKRFRFEMSVPANQPAGECRLAIMVEGEDKAPVKGVPVQVSGRIAVIVYLRVGDASPKLGLTGVGTEIVDGRRLPSVSVINRGTATGRLVGLMRAKDATGKSYAFVPSSVPILPGTSRSIVLVPQADTSGGAIPVIKYPVVMEDRIQWDNMQLPFKANFEAPSAQ